MFDLPSYSNSAPDVYAPAGPPVGSTDLAPIAGFKSGVYGMLGGAAGAASGGAKILGADDASKALGDKAAEYNAQAAQVGRPDLDSQPWLSSAFLPKLGYLAGQAAAPVGAAVAAGLGLTYGAPALGAEGLLAGAGALLPEIFGGGEAAIASGAAAHAAAGIGGAALTTVPEFFGSEINSAAQQPGGLTREHALEAAGMAIPGGVAQALVPGAGLFGRLGTGVLAKLGNSMGARFVEHGATNAAAGAVGSALQTAANLTFDPSKSTAERASDILDAASQGAVASGLFGGLAGVLRGKPSEIPNKAISDAVDAVVQPTEPQAPAAPQQLALPAPDARQLPPPAEPQDASGSPIKVAPEPGQDFTPQSPYADHTDVELWAEFKQIRQELKTADIHQSVPLQEMLGQARDEMQRRIRAVMQPQAPGEPAPAPAEPPTTNAVQAELPLAPPAETAAPGTQFNIFDPETYDAGTAPPPPTALPGPDTPVATPDAATVAAPARASLRELLKAPDAPPPNAFMQQAIQDAKVKVGRGASAFKDFVAGSTATDEASLYNELFRVDQDDKKNAALIKSPGFTRLVNRLGVGVPDLEGALAKAQAAKEPDVGQIRKLMAQIEIRDNAARLRDTSAQAQPLADVQSQPGETRQNPAQPLIQPQAAPDDAIPEHTAADLATSPAVPTDADAAGAAERASPAIQTLGPDVTAAPPAPADADPSAAPKSIAEKVIDAARSVQGIGSGGGQVDIASIRALLPDVAKEDLDAALAKIHTDGSDHTLVANPVGQRQGVDGVSVPGFGKLHKLEIAGDPNAVPVGGAEAQAPGAQAGGGQAAGGGDAAGQEIARAGDTLGAEAGSPGAAEPAGQGPAQTSLGIPPVRDAQGRLNPLEGETPEQTAARDLRLKAFGAWISSKDPLGEAGKVDLTPQEEGMVAKLAPEDPAATSPEQGAQDSAKLVATQRMLTAPAAVKEATKPVVTKLRKQARAKTAIIRTPEGDQIPTAAVGADTSDLVQATATSVDPIVDAGPAEPMAKMPWRRAAGVVDDHPTLPTEQVAAHVTRLASKLRPEVQGSIHVIDSADQLPKEITDAMARQGSNPDDLPGVYYKGEVYIRADQMRSYGEVEDVLAHEVLGHMGTRARYPDYSDYQNAMAPIFDRAGGFEGIEKLARKAGVWDENEDGHNLVNGAGLKAYMPDEPENATPYQKTKVLDELMAHVASTTPTLLDRAIYTVQDGIRKAIVNTLRRLGLHNFAAQLDTFTRADLAKWIDDNRKALAAQPKPGQIDLMAGSSDPRQFLHDSAPLGEAPYMAKLSSQQRDYQGLMGMVGSLRDRIIRDRDPDELWHPTLKDRGVKNPTALEVTRDAGRAIKENLMPRNEIAEDGKRAGMSTLLDHHELGDVEQGIQRVIEGGGNQVAQRHLELMLKDRVRGEALNDLGPLMSTNNLNPELPFSKHNWLSGLAPDELARRRELWEQGNKTFNMLGQDGKNGVRTEGQQIYRDLVTMGQMNSYMRQSQYLEKVIRTVFNGKMDAPIEYAKRFAGFDPTYVDADGRQLAHDHYNNPQAMRDYWKNAFETMHAAANSHLLDAKSRLDTSRAAAKAAVKAAAKTGDRDAVKAAQEKLKDEDALSRPYSDLKDLLDSQRNTEQNEVNQGSYFHLGRTGPYAVGFKINGVKDADGNVTNVADPADLDALQKGFAKNFPQVMIGNFSNNRQVFVRFPSENMAKRFASLVQEGEKGVLRKHIDTKEGTHVSLLEEAKSVEGSVPFLPQLLDTASARFDQDLSKLTPGTDEYIALDKSRAKFLGGLRSALINLGADNSMRVLSARRDNVQGANADMIANQKAAWETHARDTAGLAVQAEKTKALADARQAITDIGKSQTQDAFARAVRAKRIFNAYQSANDAAGVNINAPLLTRLKSVLHTFQLGGSPAYMIMALSQNPLLTFPELARFHSFARTTTAMMQSLGPTARLMGALVKSSNIFEGGITPEIVKQAGFDPTTQQEILRWVDHGLMEQGSYTNVNQGFGIGSMGRVQRFQHYANSTALAAELASRLVAAFSAKDLYEAKEGQANASLMKQYPSVTNYVARVVKQSMFEWGGNNTPKAFLAGGPLAKAGPLIGQFHGFTPRLATLIYRNALDGYTNRLNDPQLKSEARRFTNYHLAAATALAGGLGLPLVGTGLGAATRVSGWVGQQPYDMEAHLRGWLAHTFGQDAGEILSRGIPRYMGIDTSDLGDAGLAPLGRLLEDRRPFEDAAADYLSHAWGSAPSMIVNSAVAMREMSEGRFAEAGARALPTVMRNLVRASRIAQYGYTTSTGERIPVKADGTSVAKAALGFTDGALAEEKDKQDNVRNLNIDRQYASSVIKKQIALANMRGDHVMMAKALEAARKYDQDNPGQMLSASIPGFLASRGKAEALSQQSGVLGINPTDRAALALTRY